MRLRLLGTESGHTGCPALYATDRGTYVVQGKLVKDPEAIADLVDVRDDEFYVEIPQGLLRFAAGRRVSSFIAGPALASVVLGYEHTAFRLEQRDDQYHEPEEDEPYRRFLNGESATVTGWNDEWEQMLQSRSADGQRMTRVRVVGEPHSDYTRFLLALAAVNVPAGEDIRYLARDRARKLDLPHYDFWVIDSLRVVILRFAEDNTLVGAQVDEDPAIVVRHCYYRDVACHYAAPFTQYVRC